jgi:outer membrane receptor protein involved in Fe transport
MLMALLSILLGRVSEAADARLVQAIEAQPLSQALISLANQTGLQILYVSTLAQDKRSAPVPAGLLANIALQRLLAGSGVAYEFLNDHAVRLYARSASVVSPITPPALEEVVVVANSREQQLLMVPLSARVVSTAELIPFSIARVDQALALVPGIDYNTSSQWGAGLYNRISMRGIVGERSGSTTVIYLDDTALFDALTPHSAFTVPYPALFDLDRVEVLRGPQGVDFGAGAEGGAIRFVSKRANTWENSSAIDLDLGALDHGGSVGSISAVVADALIPEKLGVRAGFYARDEGGYVDRINPFTGSVVEANANRSFQRDARISADYEPNDTLSIRPSFSYQASRLHDSSVFYRTLSQPQAGSFVNGKLMAQPYDDVLTVGSVRVDRRWPTVNLTSVTSYLARTDRAIIDQTNEAGAFYFGGYGSALGPEVPVSYDNAVTNKSSATVRMWSQEFRLVSPDVGRRLVWSAGAYFGDYLRRQSDQSYVAAMPSLAALSRDDSDHSSEFSAFGQVSWRINSRWKIGGGLRVGSFRLSAVSFSGGLLQSDGPVPVRVRNSGPLPLTPRVDVSYQISQNWMGYGVISQGSRVGRSTAQVMTCAAETAQSYYGTDRLSNYEVGAKGSFLDGILTIDTAVYDIEWRDVQMRTYDPCGHSYMTNAGNVVSRGGDLAMQARMTPRWTVALNLSVGEVHSLDTVVGMGGLLISQRGAALPGVPDVPAPWSGSVSSQYEWAIGSDTRAVWRTLWLARSHHPGPFPELDPSFPTYDPRFVADPAYQQWNMSVEMVRHRFSVRLYCNNMLNARPVLQTSGDAPGTPILYAYTLVPRTWGVAFSWR